MAVLSIEGHSVSSTSVGAESTYTAWCFISYDEVLLLIKPRWARFPALSLMRIRRFMFCESGMSGPNLAHH